LVCFVTTICGGFYLGNPAQLKRWFIRLYDDESPKKIHGFTGQIWLIYCNTTKWL
jgi:hypothetical protein